MTSSSLRVVVSGLIGQYPIGGNAWAYFQYVLGLSRLGHDVFYIEDTGQWPYNPQEGGVSKGCEYNVAYIDEIMRAHGLEGRWAYCFAWESQWFGMSDTKRREVLASADLLINVSGSLQRPEKNGGPRRLAFIDTDPVFTQVKLARGHEDLRRLVDAHDVHFSFGEAMSELVPDTGHRWLPTRQPVSLEEWQPVEDFRESFTTVMNWTSYNPVAFGGKTYGQKDEEFMRFIDLPARAPTTSFELAVNAGKTRRTPYELLRHKGWNVVDPALVCPDLHSYRDYIRTSKAEWTVAKNGYVEGRPGWFSERSAVYLAAGRPVVTQDTAFDSVLPVGEGLMSFRTLDEAVDCVRAVEGDYARHSASARAIALEYFDSSTVLTRLLDRAMESPYVSG